jgi:hypothetical protein
VRGWRHLGSSRTYAALGVANCHESTALVLDGVLGWEHRHDAREVWVDDDFPRGLQAVFARWGRLVGLRSSRQRKDFAIVGSANLDDALPHPLYSAMKLEAASDPAGRRYVRPTRRCEPRSTVRSSLDNTIAV